jgi:cell division protein FtsB
VDVEKGIAEVRLVKKKHTEELKQLEKSDPEWLLELKKQDEQEAIEEAARKKVPSVKRGYYVKPCKLTGFHF